MRSNLQLHDYKTTTMTTEQPQPPFDHLMMWAVTKTRRVLFTKCTQDLAGDENGLKMSALERRGRLVHFLNEIFRDDINKHFWWLFGLFSKSGERVEDPRE